MRRWAWVGAIVSAGVLAWALWPSPPAERLAGGGTDRTRGGDERRDPITGLRPREAGGAPGEEGGAAANARSGNAAPRVDPDALVLRILGEDGTPVARAFVRTLADRDGKPVLEDANAFTWPSGWRVNAPTAAVWIEVFRAQDAAGKDLPWASAVHGPVAPGTREVEIRLHAESAIEGVVRSAAGEPLPGVTLDAAPSPVAPRHSASMSTARSAEGGRFRLGGLRPGTYVLDAIPLGPHARPYHGTAEAGAKDVEVRMKRGIVATLVVVDAEGKPVPNAKVRAEAVSTGAAVPRITGGYAYDPFGPDSTDDEGRIRLQGLDPTVPHDLQIRGWGRKDVLPLWDRAWTPKDETIRLKAARAIRGVVRNVAGQPVAGAGVQASSTDVRSDFFPEDAWSDAGGAFTVTPLPEGEFRLRASVPGRDLETAANVDAQAGAEGVVLVVESVPRRDLAIRIEGWPPEAKGALANLAPESPGGMDASELVAPDGTVRFRRLATKQVYVVGIWLPRGSHAYLRGLVPRDEPYEVRLVPGKSIRGRVIVPEGVVATHVAVSASAPGFSASASPDASGEYEIRGLPDVAFRVTASGVGERSTYLSASLDVEAGDTADFDLRPSAER